MAFSNDELGEIDAIVGHWCLSRVKPELKSKIDYDYEIDDQAVTLLEVRPAWRGAPGEKTRLPVAKFKYFKTSELWKIYWMRRTGKWQLYKPDGLHYELDDALVAVERDDFGCFFG